MSFETNTQRPSPENYQNLSTTAEVLTKYDEACSELVESQRMQLGVITNTHDVQFNMEASHPNSIPVNNALSATYSAVNTVTGVHEKLVSETILDTSNTLRSMMSYDDQWVLDNVRWQASARGVGSFDVTKALKGASSLEVRKAMRASLDDIVLSKARAEALKPNANNKLIDEIVGSASTSNVQDAIKVSLDASLLGNAHKNTQLHGVDSKHVANALEGASSPTAQAAMRSSLDMRVLTELNKWAATTPYDVDSPVITSVLDMASNNSVRTVFEREFKLARQPVGGTFTEEELLADLLRKLGLGGNSGTRTRTQAGNAPGGTRFIPYNKPVPDPYAREKRIVQQVVGQHKGVGWLKSTPVEDIKDVVTEVENMRRQNGRDGKPVTDKEVYLQLRKNAEKGLDEQGRSEADPRAVAKLQIVEALMGGDKNGNLPF